MSKATRTLEIVCAALTIGCSDPDGVTPDAGPAEDASAVGGAANASAGGAGVGDGGGTGGSGGGRRDGGAAPCPATAPCVLFYGPIVFDADPVPLDPTVYEPFEKPFLPAGSVVTIADDAAWKAMATEDFAAYSLVIIGDNLDWHPHPDYLQSAFDTRATWNPAITGRVVVQGIDAGFHTAHSENPEAAQTYLRATLSWLTQGGGTALYVSSIARDYDYLSDLGAFTSISDEGDAVTLDEPSHPIFTGSTAASLSNWVMTYHRSTMAMPSGFVRVASAASGNALVLVRDR